MPNYGVKSMMIFKYDLSAEDLQTLKLPVGSELLTVQIQDGAPRLWAVVDAEETRTEDHIVGVALTGHPIPWGVEKHLGTVQIPTTGFVYHFFEVSSVLVDPKATHDPDAGRHYSGGGGRGGHTFY